MKSSGLTSVLAKVGFNITGSELVNVNDMVVIMMSAGSMGWRRRRRGDGSGIAIRGGDGGGGGDGSKVILLALHV